MSEPEGIDLSVDLESYQALVAEDRAQWAAFKASEFGKLFLDQIEEAVTSEEES